MKALRRPRSSGLKATAGRQPTTESLSRRAQPVFAALRIETPSPATRLSCVQLHEDVLQPQAFNGDLCVESVRQTCLRTRVPTAHDDVGPGSVIADGEALRNTQISRERTSAANIVANHGLL